MRVWDIEYAFHDAGGWGQDVEVPLFYVECHVRDVEVAFIYGKDRVRDVEVSCPLCRWLRSGRGGVHLLCRGESLGRKVRLP